MLIPSRDTEPYYPSPESQGGWRFLKKKDDIHHLAQMDSNKIDRLFDRHSIFFWNTFIEHCDYPTWISCS